MLKQFLKRNLWSQNVAAVQLLGLCPLLAVSNSVANASGLAIASAFVLIGSATLISLLRRLIPDVVRLPMFVLVIATFTTIVVLIMEAFAFSLYMQIALFMQIIVTNCMILGRINQVASKEKLGVAVLDAVTTSVGFAIVLIGFGAVRELTSLALPLALDPTGAFLIFGLLLAGYQFVDRRIEDRTPPNIVSQAEAL
ncbi:MAG: electron transport complex subunit RsxE [Gammaproteobacteria bacterium]|nr:electron transport complex subunit RsxE [Gammaproteobacteria bacterium]